MTTRITITKKMSTLLLLSALTILASSCASQQQTPGASASATSSASGTPAASTKVQSSSSTSPAPTSSASNGGFTWKESTPKEQGLDDKSFEPIDADIIKNYANIYSFMVIKNGAIVYEKYYHNHNKDTYTSVFSVTKSVVSALTGIALKEGYLKSVDQKFSDIFPLYFTKETAPAKKDITIKHALTMTGGLNAVDTNISGWFNSPDYVKYVLNLPSTSPLGTTFTYNTGLPHLLSAAITETTGQSTKDFADKYLFGPLDIHNYKWEQDPKGIYNGGTNLSLTPRDMAKLGYVYLHHGKWQDKQLIPEAWVEASTKQQVKVDANTGYGYLFWTSEFDGKEKKIAAYEANGYGGQHIRVIPELDTIVVVTSDPAMQNGRNANELVQKYIVTANGF